MNIDIWKEKTKGLFHILEYNKFWNYINNLKENDILINDIKVLLKENEAKEKVIIKQDNVLNELKELFKEFHKYQSRLKWNEEDYIEFIKHLENELKESDK